MVIVDGSSYSYAWIEWNWCRVPRPEEEVQSWHWLCSDLPYWLDLRHWSQPQSRFWGDYQWYINHAQSLDSLDICSFKNTWRMMTLNKSIIKSAILHYHTAPTLTIYFWCMHFWREWLALHWKECINCSLGAPRTQWTRVPGTTRFLYRALRRFRSVSLGF